MKNSNRLNLIFVLIITSLFFGSEAFGQAVFLEFKAESNSSNIKFQYQDFEIYEGTSPYQST